MIRIEHLDKYYNRGRKNENHVLKDVNLEFPDTGLVCITGESGCGKTSLLNAMGGIDYFQNGCIIYDGGDVLKYGRNRMDQYRSQKISYIFQNYYLIADQTVEYNIILALKMLSMTEDERQERADQVLDAVGMRKYKYKLVSKLSGGQQQRVSIARALVKSPDIIFADEPTGNLDEEKTIRVMNLLKIVSRECLVVLVSHEQDMVKSFADRIIQIRDGEVVSDRENLTDGTFQRMDGRDIYLQDLSEEQAFFDGLEVQVYREPGISPHGKVRMAWKDGKIYIEGLEETEVVLAGEEAGCEMIEGSRPELEAIEDIEEDFSIERLIGERRRRLSVKDIFQMAGRNLKYLGKKRISLSIVMGIAALLLMLTVTDLLQQHSVDRRRAQQTDSHFLTVRFEPAGKVVDGKKFSEQMEQFYENMIVKKGYTDVSVDTNAVLNVYYNGFEQIYGFLCRTTDFSAASLKEITEDDLSCGRMPENRNETVIDRWLIERLRKEENIFAELFAEDASVLGTEVTLTMEGTKKTVVGVSKMDEPTVYVTDSVLLGISHSGTKAMTDTELRELGLPGYQDIHLRGKEMLVSEDERHAIKAVEDEKDEIMLSKIRERFGEDCEITGYFMEDLGVKYIVSEEMLGDLVKRHVLGAEYCDIYAKDTAHAIEEMKKSQKEAGDQLKISVISSSEEQLKEYQKKHQSAIRISPAVTASMLMICALMIYFTIRSNVLGRWEELTVYRLLGIRTGDIVKLYVFEMLWISFCVCCPLILAYWAAVSYAAAIPSMEMYLYFPWWAAIGIFAGLELVQAVLCILPVSEILSKAPVELMR